MEFDKLYKELMEAYLANIQNAEDLRTVNIGQQTEDRFAQYATKKGYIVKQATPDEDRTERWDFKLYSEVNGRRIPALQDHKLSGYAPVDIPKLKGTVDVKSKALKGDNYLIMLISKGRGEGWTRGINWVAIPEGSTFRLIHVPSMIKILREKANIIIENPHTTNVNVVSTDPKRPLRYTTIGSQLSITDGILFGDGRTTAGIAVKTTAILAFSFLL